MFGMGFTRLTAGHWQCWAPSGGSGGESAPLSFSSSSRQPVPLGLWAPAPSPKPTARPPQCFLTLTLWPPSHGDPCESSGLAGTSQESPPVSDP